MGASTRRPGVCSTLLVSFAFLVQTWTSFRFPVAVESTLVANCSFENQSAPYCPGWSVPQWTDGPWNSSKASDSTATGPSSPEASAGGESYLFLNSDLYKNDQGITIAGKTVGLRTPVLPRTSCIAFLYIKHGDNDRIGQLRVGQTKGIAAQEKGPVLWAKNGTTGNDWQCQLVNAAVENQSIYWVAESGNTGLGDTAMDEVRIFDTPCPDDNSCLALVSGNLVTSSSALTSASTSASTQSPSSNSTRTSATGDGGTATTQQNSDEEGLTVDEIILLSTIIPVVVLITAGVIAFVCFRRRNAQKRAQMEEERGRQYSAPPPEEDYDEIPDDSTSTSYYSTPNPVYNSQNDYDVIQDH